MFAVAAESGLLAAGNHFCGVMKQKNFVLRSEHDLKTGYKIAGYRNMYNPARNESLEHNFRLMLLIWPTQRRTGGAIPQPEKSKPPAKWRADASLESRCLL
jgi:hypothetical protein